MIITLLLISTVFSHSWLECTKYEGDLEVFEADKCIGRPRPLNANGQNVGNVFGQDIGMDFRPDANGRCQGDASLGTAQNFPNGLISYEGGNTYTIAWPPKNHVAAECTNPNIPDEFLRLYMAPYDQNAGDPDQATFKQNQVPASFSDEPHVNGQIDFKGFQNCPNFCDDTDKSLCTGTFTLPADVPVGVYTFQWYWAFNGENDLYATCWEAEVLAATNGGNTDNDDDSDENGGFSEPVQPCTNCCPSNEVIAPGTGTLTQYPNIDEGADAWVDCPDGYAGEFKIFCLDNDPRVVDGFCQINKAASNDQGGAVAGLSVVLVFVLIGFFVYATSKEGLIDYPKLYGQLCSSDVENPVKQAASTQDNVSLPRAPTVPAAIEWYYVDSNETTVGPVAEDVVIQYCAGLGLTKASETLVWNSTSLSDWVSVRNVTSLYSKVKMSCASLSVE